MLLMKSMCTFFYPYSCIFWTTTRYILTMRSRCFSRLWAPIEEMLAPSGIKWQFLPQATYLYKITIFKILSEINEIVSGTSVQEWEAHFFLCCESSLTSIQSVQAPFTSEWCLYCTSMGFVPTWLHLLYNIALVRSVSSHIHPQIQIPDSFITWTSYSHFLRIYRWLYYFPDF